MTRGLVDLRTCGLVDDVESGRCGLGGVLKELVSSTVRPDMSAGLLYRHSSEYRIGLMQRGLYFVGSH